MRIMEWNLQYGGAQERLPGIIEAVRRHDPDILVLLEFRPERVIEVSLSLAALGYPYILELPASRRAPTGYWSPPRSALVQLPGGKALSSPHRWMEVVSGRFRPAHPGGARARGVRPARKDGVLVGFAGIRHGVHGPRRTAA